MSGFKSLAVLACAAGVGLYGVSVFAQAQKVTDPKDMPGLVLWLDAADAKSLTVEKDKVKVWMNKAAGDKKFGDAKQGAATNQPAYGKNQLNKQAVLTLGPGEANAQPHWLEGDMPRDISNKDVTMFAVSMRTDDDGKSWEQVIYLGADSDMGARDGVPHLGKRNTTSQWGFHNAWRLDEGVFIEQGANAIGKWWITSLTRNKSGNDGNGADLAVKGFGPAMLKAAGTQNWASGNSSKYSVGRQGETGSVFGFGGQIAEILVFNRALTDEEQAKVLDYLGTKWAVPVK